MHFFSPEVGASDSFADVTFVVDLPFDPTKEAIFGVWALVLSIFWPSVALTMVLLGLLRASLSSLLAVASLQTTFLTTDRNESKSKCRRSNLNCNMLNESESNCYHGPFLHVKHHSGWSHTEVA